MIKVGFNPVISFKADETAARRKGYVDIPSVDAQQDKFESRVKPKKESSIRRGTANVWKFFAVTNTMVGATIKGLIYGGLTGTAVAGAFWTFKALPKAFTKDGPTIGNIIKTPAKYIGIYGKIASIASAVAVLGYHVVAGKLNANQKTAVIDHKLKTGHRDT